jgi:signal transduction histidine kinase
MEEVMKKIFAMLAICAALLTFAAVVWGAKPAKEKPGGTQTQREVLKAAVHVAASSLAGVAVKTDGTYDVETIRKFVNSVRFLDDQTGYFYVYDSTNNFCIAHAILKDFEGKDKTDYTDSRGMKVIQELSKIAVDTPIGGYLNFYWMNPKTTKEEKKLGYIEMIPGTKLYVGSGIYVK